MTWSSKLKVHRTNSQTTSLYSITFYVRYSLFFFSFCYFWYCCWCCCCWLKIYILINIWLYGRVSDIKNLTRSISRNKTTFFGLILSKIHVKSRSKDWIRKKNIEEFAWGTSLIWLRPLLSVLFFASFFFLSVPLPK